MIYSIYKTSRKEFKAFFHSPFAYVVTGLFILITAVFFWVGNINAQSADLNALLYSMGTLLLFIVPIITMKSLAEDKKSGTEVLLVTSPTRISAIIAGKYLAILLFFLVITGITLIYPLTLLLFSSQSLLSLLGAYTGFILLGAALIAVGIFASSITENQVVAATVSFTSFIFLLLLQPAGYQTGGTISKALNWFSVFSRYSDFTRGIFDLNTVLYYFSFIFFFLFLTIRVMEKNKLKNLLGSRNFKYGTNSILLIAGVLAILVFINLFAEKFTFKFDLTQNKVYSIGNTTEAILDKLDKDIVIYGLFDDGKIDSDYKEVKDLLESYTGNSRHIKVKYIDPDIDASIIKKLDPDGSKALKKNDFIVACGSKSKKLSYENLFKLEIDQQTFARYKTGSTAEQGFTGAIKYVAADKTPSLYFVEGHEEGKLDTQYKTLKEYLEKNNFNIKKINISKAEAIPEDAEILLFISPKKDLSSNEYGKVNEYLKKGGRAAFLFDYIASDPAFSRFDSILSSYSLSINHDKVKENDASKHVPNNKYGILEGVGKNSVIPIDFEIYLPDSRSIKTLKNVKSSVSLIPLISTSIHSVGEAVDKQKGGNLQGPLTLGIAAESKAPGRHSKILVLGNSTFLGESAGQQYSPNFSSGIYFFVSSLGWLQDKTDDLVISPKAYDNQKLKINQFTANLVGVYVIAVVPLAILSMGFYVWKRRRYL